jgi:hypothetical protein
MKDAAEATNSKHVPSMIWEELAGSADLFHTIEKPLQTESALGGHANEDKHGRDDWI